MFSIRNILLTIFVLVCTTFCVSGTDTTKIIKLLDHFPSKSSYEVKRDFVRTLYDSLNAKPKQLEGYYFLKTGISYFRNNGDVLMEATVMNSLGLFYNNIGKYGEATKVFSEAIRLLEKHDFSDAEKSGKQSVLYLLNLNYGNTFYFLGAQEKSLLHYKRAYNAIVKKGKFDREDSLKIAKVFNNFGITYSVKKDYETGVYYFNKALEMNTRLRDTTKIVDVLSNLASLHSTKNEIDSALSKYFRVKYFYESQKGRDNIAFVNSEIASLYYNNQMPKSALPYALIALKYTDTTLFSRQSISTYEILHHIYSDLKDYKNEVKYLKLYMAASDSIDNVETLNEINKNEMLIQFNTAHVTDSIKGVEDLKNKDLKIQSKKNQSYFLIVLLLITFSAMGLIYSRFKVTKKQKNIIEEQKGIVEEKQKEIIDSIKYAKRIQSSLLPTEKYIDKSFKRLKNK